MNNRAFFLSIKDISKSTSSHKEHHCTNCLGLMNIVKGTLISSKARLVIDIAAQKDVQRLVFKIIVTNVDGVLISEHLSVGNSDVTDDLENQ
jgi:hypothetical protein